MVEVGTNTDSQVLIQSQPEDAQLMSSPLDDNKLIVLARRDIVRLAKLLQMPIDRLLEAIESIEHAYRIEPAVVEFVNEEICDADGALYPVSSSGVSAISATPPTQ